MDGVEQALKQAVKAYARSVGLDMTGVAAAAPFVTEQERLRRRAAEGLGPNPFEPQEIETRINPDRLLPGVRSIIAGGISYLMPDAPEADGEAGGPAPEGPIPVAPAPGAPKGWLSRYCRGQDYHALLKARLDQVARWLEHQVPGARTLVYVDTGPPLDRAVAERAGIGKFGKHTNLITPEYGTWVFLGEILTDVALPPDLPVEAACGACTLCIDACPTQALTEWNLDANRCLSYITQMKGIIPLEYREVLGNRLFGCDDCQDVCPYNRKAKSGLHPEFAPVPEIGPAPDLLTLMAMTKSDFRRWFAPTAAGWRGKTTIQRNALLALGNAGAPAALPALREALSSESPVIRAHAAWALGRLARLAPAAAPEAQAALAGRQAVEQDPAVQAEISAALS
ncbi:MAG TPA: tRNA epoxyqueuosine(34) reductase QueG [Symbiobacteriaceae bacterium]|jgi:epoxyqueuosine reductase